jgi:hypothetical protein
MLARIHLLPCGHLLLQLTSGVTSMRWSSLGSWAKLGVTSSQDGLTHRIGHKKRRQSLHGRHGGEKRLLCKHGRHRDCSLALTPVPPKGSKRVGGLAITSDLCSDLGQALAIGARVRNQVPLQLWGILCAVYASFCNLSKQGIVLCSYDLGSTDIRIASAARSTLLCSKRRRHRQNQLPDALARRLHPV